MGVFIFGPFQLFGMVSFSFYFDSFEEKKKCVDKKVGELGKLDKISILSPVSKKTKSFDANNRYKTDFQKMIFHNSFSGKSSFPKNQCRNFSSTWVRKTQDAKSMRLNTLVRKTQDAKSMRLNSLVRKTQDAKSMCLNSGDELFVTFLDTQFTTEFQPRGILKFLECEINIESFN